MCVSEHLLHIHSTSESSHIFTVTVDDFRRNENRRGESAEALWKFDNSNC